MNTIAIAALIAVGCTLYLLACVASLLWGLEHKHTLIGSIPTLLLFTVFVFCIAMLALTGGES